MRSALDGVDLFVNAAVPGTPATLRAPCWRSAPSWLDVRLDRGQAHALDLLSIEWLPVGAAS